jgi:hypothetical protein
MNNRGVQLELELKDGFMANRQRITRPRRLAVLAVVLVFTLVSAGIVCARESWPQPTDAAKRRAEEFKRHAEEVWQRIAPGLERWAKQGKPFLPRSIRSSARKHAMRLQAKF